jgi:tRNA1Val (adenine37-N6)-methyltransferase
MTGNESVFYFKHFAIKQDKCAMKIGTDGVLLGAWVDKGSAKRVLDVGTGTGLVALMLAQRTVAFIDAVDIDTLAFEQSRDNFINSPWKERLTSFNESLQDFAAKNGGEAYDLIVSNPPYFMNSPKPNVDARTTARHMDETLTPEELINAVVYLLSTTGRFCAILPLREGTLFIEAAEKKKLYCNKIVRVYTKTDKAEKRLLLSFSKKRTDIITESLVIQNASGEYSNEFIALIQDYYTHLPGLPNL